MDINQRLAIFFQRLAGAPSARTAEEALELICRLIEQVEEEFCPMPREEPAPLRFTGRMYAPRLDNVLSRNDGSMWINLRHRIISIEPNGAFTIYRVIPGQGLLRELKKAGRSE